jgi:hypothetical protein
VLWQKAQPAEFGPGLSMVLPRALSEVDQLVGDGLATATAEEAEHAGTREQEQKPRAAVARLDRRFVHQSCARETGVGQEKAT